MNKLFTYILNIQFLKKLSNATAIIVFITTILTPTNIFASLATRLRRRSTVRLDIFRDYNKLLPSIVLNKWELSVMFRHDVRKGGAKCHADFLAPAALSHPTLRVYMHNIFIMYVFLFLHALYALYLTTSTRLCSTSERRSAENRWFFNGVLARPSANTV